jgi:hypothetical protein
MGEKVIARVQAAVMRPLHVIVILSFMLYSCDFDTSGEKLEKQKQQIATELSSRISSVIYHNGFTPEWNTVCSRIMENKDTLFLSQNVDFTILVTMRPNLILDSLNVLKDSLVRDSVQRTGRSWRPW